MAAVILSEPLRHQPTVTVGLCGMLYYRFKRSGWL